MPFSASCTEATRGFCWRQALLFPSDPGLLLADIGWEAASMRTGHSWYCQSSQRRLCKCGARRANRFDGRQNSNYTRRGVHKVSFVMRWYDLTLYLSRPFSDNRCLSVSLCLSLYMYVYICLCLTLSLSASPCLSIYVSVCLSVFIYLSVCLYIPVSLSVCLDASALFHHSLSQSLTLYLSFSSPWFWRSSIAW